MRRPDHLPVETTNSDGENNRQAPALTAGNFERLGRHSFEWIQSYPNSFSRAIQFSPYRSTYTNAQESFMESFENILFQTERVNTRSEETSTPTLPTENRHTQFSESNWSGLREQRSNAFQLNSLQRSSSRNNTRPNFTRFNESIWSELRERLAYMAPEQLATLGVRFPERGQQTDSETEVVSEENVNANEIYEDNEINDVRQLNNARQRLDELFESSESEATPRYIPGLERVLDDSDYEHYHPLENDGAPNLPIPPRQLPTDEDFSNRFFRTFNFNRDTPQSQISTEPLQPPESDIERRTDRTMQIHRSSARRPSWLRESLRESKPTPYHRMDSVSCLTEHFLSHVVDPKQCSPETFSFLAPGRAFSGVQTSPPYCHIHSTEHETEQEQWQVRVVIQSFDVAKSICSGVMEAINTPSNFSTVMTLWDGQVIDFNNFHLWTRAWDATHLDDIRHWKRFKPFIELCRLYRQRYSSGERRDFTATLNEIYSQYTFMRWKERAFVNAIDRDSGLTIAGFYYIAIKRSNGHIEGFYCDPKTKPFQKLDLKPVVDDQGLCFQSFSFR